MFGIYNNVQRYISKHNVFLSYFAKVKCRRLYFNNVLDVNTNVARDLILFKYDKPKFFRYLNIFGVCQFVFWSYLSHFAYTRLKDAPIEKKEDDPWWKAINVGENKYRNGITFLCCLLGKCISIIGRGESLQRSAGDCARRFGAVFPSFNYTGSDKC